MLQAFDLTGKTTLATGCKRGIGQAAEHFDAYWNTVTNTNLSAPFILTREIGRGIVERGSGKIIFTASLLAFLGSITVQGYAATKKVVGRLVKAFVNEWVSKNSNANAIAPGYIATNNWVGR
ncbi:SDR family NAD(P)-dependent oxidoreductase [Spirosoma sp. BT704]|uniref:SDR family NAD(P)-dependent oxidoreductase n=1 Tax=Spirosoma validum TaxID=2771355 RepID=A0A927B2F2_9BACT|nr:SDR family NAD(P)-dependent oxidoreductase [Spirosoma validum]